MREHGISNINVDLVFGIPGQGKKGIFDDIDQAAALSPKHISFYALTLSKQHPLFQGLPSDEASAELYEAGVGRLESHGYQQYEISNFSIPGYESSHNLLYWDGGDFLGLGPSASSRFFHEGAFWHRKGSE